MAGRALGAHPALFRYNRPIPMHEHSKFLLLDSQIPTVWVNVLPSLKEPLDPPLNPQTRAPLGPQDLAPLFPREIIEQEFSPKPEIDIPGEVMDIYYCTGRRWTRAVASFSPALNERSMM